MISCLLAPIFALSWHLGTHGFLFANIAYGLLVLFYVISKYDVGTGA
jgi:hypothetical protein